jgi:excisionase family DNA binding protein
MKTEFEPSEIEEIAQKVAEIILPRLHQNAEVVGNTIFDVEGLADYLKVGKQWVYEKVHRNDIPHFKMGKYPRFRKSDIDRWLDTKRRGKGGKAAKTVRRLLEDTL